MLPGMGGIMAGVGGPTQITAANVISAQARTGTGASASIITSFAPDLYIGKGRSGATDWGWYDTSRGVQKDLVSNSTVTETTQATGLTAFNSNGVTIGALAKLNTNADTYFDLLLKKGTGFLDIPTWTGDGDAGKLVPHTIGAVPGFIVIKNREQITNWVALCRTSGTNYKYIRFNSNAAEVSDVTISNAANASNIKVGWIDANVAGANVLGDDYVAYAFGHDTSATGIVWAGAFTTDGSGAATVTGLPAAPQIVLTKCSGASGDWRILDTTRGWAGGADKSLLFNTAGAEVTATDYGAPTSDGFTAANHVTSQPHVYLALRAP